MHNKNEKSSRTIIIKDKNYENTLFKINKTYSEAILKVKKLLNKSTTIKRNEFPKLLKSGPVVIPAS